MSARALAALSPIDETVSKVTALTLELASYVTACMRTYEIDSSGRMALALDMNGIQGALSQVHELLQNLHRQTRAVGANRAFFVPLLAQLGVDLLPALVSLYRLISGEESSGNAAATNTAAIKRLFKNCPPVMLLFLRAVGAAQLVVETGYLVLSCGDRNGSRINGDSGGRSEPDALWGTVQTARHLCSVLCIRSLKDIMSSTSTSTSVALAPSVLLDIARLSYVPMQPVLWKECVCAILPLAIHSVLTHRLASEAVPTVTAPLTALSVSHSESSQSALANTATSPNSPTNTDANPVWVEDESLLTTLLQLLHSPISEIREGVLMGLLAVYDPASHPCLAAARLTQLSNRSYVAQAHFLLTSTSAAAASTSAITSRGCDLMSTVLHLSLGERLPPVKRKALRLLWEMTTLTDFSKLPLPLNNEFQAAFTNFRFIVFHGDTAFASVSGSVNDPLRLDSSCEVVGYGDDEVLTKIPPSSPPPSSPPPTVQLSPTTSAAYSLQILGWIVKADVETNSPHNQPLGSQARDTTQGVAQEPLLRPKGAVSLGRARVLSWLSLLTAAVDEREGTVTRAAAVSVRHSLIQFVCQSVCLSVCLSVCQSVSLSVSQSVSQSV